MTSDLQFVRVRSGLTLLRLSIWAFAVLVATATQAKAVDLDHLTVVTLARDGSWGVATANSQGQAIAEAIRDCRAMAAAQSDCGAYSVTTRGGWVVADMCGDQQIIATAETREGAGLAALNREADLRRLYAPSLPSCGRVLTVGPSGAIVTQTDLTHQIDARRKER